MSIDALKKEGSKEEMGHCVGGYAYQCYFDDLHVLSLRGQNESWRTTLGLKFNKEGKIEAVQHTGPRNDPIEDRAKQAQTWLVENINSGALPINRALLDAFRQERKKRSPKIAMKKFL